MQLDIIRPSWQAGMPIWSASQVGAAVEATHLVACQSLGGQLPYLQLYSFQVNDLQVEMHMGIHLYCQKQILPFIKLLSPCLRQASAAVTGADRGALTWLINLSIFPR
jgi:hypothetical protein